MEALKIIYSEHVNDVQYSVMSNDNGNLWLHMDNRKTKKNSIIVRLKDITDVMERIIDKESIEE